MGLLMHQELNFAQGLCDLLNLYLILFFVLQTVLHDRIDKHTAPLSYLQRFLLIASAVHHK